MESARRRLGGPRQEKRGRHHAGGVKQLGERTRVSIIKSPRDQDLSVGEQGGNVIATPADQGKGWRPFSRGGIVDFGGGWKNAAEIACASGRQDPAAWQQRGRVRLARLAHGTGWRPRAGGWVKNLGTGEDRVRIDSYCNRVHASATSNQHLAVRQECGRVRATRRLERTGWRPNFIRRIVDFYGG